MRSLITYGLPSCLILLACGPGGGGSSGSTGEASSSTSGGPTSTGGTSGPTTGAATGTGTDSSTTGTGTTSTTGTSGTSTSGTATTDETSTSSGTSGGPVEGACVKDADCKLHEDCCVCEGVPVGDNPASCELECKQPLCQEFGIDAAVCRLGACDTERLSCDQTKVVCNGPPPVCAPGTLPETDPDCWTGRCVPAVLCDVIPDCSSCPDGRMCVQYTGEGIFPTVCEPIPPECGGTPSCECAADQVCTGIFTVCSEKGAVIGCDCPNC